MASRLSLAEAKSQRGTARSTLAIEPGTALPFTAETPLPRKAKNAPARRRVPQMAKSAQARRSLALHGRNSLAEAKSVPARRRVPLGLAHRWPYNSVACNPFWKSLHSQPKIPLWGSNGCRPHLSPLIRTFTPFYKGGFAVHDGHRLLNRRLTPTCTRSVASLMLLTYHVTEQRSLGRWREPLNG